jgi:hypothetical protein
VNCVECKYLIEQEAARAKAKGREPSKGIGFQVAPGSNFCSGHQPKIDDVSPILRSGYYVPKTGALIGDPEFARESQRIFCDVLGLASQFAGNYDGVSIHIGADGKQRTRLTIRDFFNAENILVRDL